MDAQTFIAKDSEKQMAEFYKAYGCDFQSHDTVKMSDSINVKEYKRKIFFDQIRYKIFFGVSKDALIDTLKSDRFPVATVKDLEDNCIEVDDVVTVRWYGKKSGKTNDFEVGINISYIVKDNKVISHYAQLQ
jgi:hypothetical protein